MLMKLPVVVFSDLHVNDYRRFNVGSVRLGHCIRALRDVVSYAVNRKSRYVLFAGDLYDTPKQLLTTVVNATVAAFTEIFREHPTLVFLAISGNHDQGSKNLYGQQCITALEHLATLFPENFILLDNAAKTLVTGFDCPDDITVHGIPYYEFPTHFDQALDAAIIRANEVDQERGKPGLHYLLIHQTPDLGSDVIAPDFANDDPRLARFRYVFCGHIHLRAQITKNLLVVGSPLHRDAADEGQEKGFISLDLAAPKTWRLVSTKGRYPEFKTLAYGQQPTEEEQGQYLLIGAPPLELAPEEKANAAAYDAGLAPAQLLTNFWQQQTGGEDPELLREGLKLLETVAEP